MPSTARIAILILLLLLPGSLLAQTLENAPADRLHGAEADQPPTWVKRLPDTAPVLVPPPLPAVNKDVLPVGFQEPQSSDNRNNSDITPFSRSMSEMDSGSSAPAKKQTAPLRPMRDSRIPLSPSGKTSSDDATKKPAGMPSMVTVAGSLGVVLGIFLLAAWLFRRAAPQGFSRLPNEAFEVLGRAPLAGRQNVHLLRCGNKLLLVSITPTGTETLTEITDPPEVDRLAGLCRQAGPQSSTAAFRQIFEQLAPKRPTRGAFLRNEYADYYPPEIEMPDDTSWERRHV